MIESIAIRGMKSHEDFSINLTEGKAVLVGPNGSGKSAVLDAVRFAILGYVPALGKRPADTAILMSGSDMGVMLTLDGDRTIRRSLKRSGKKLIGSVEASWIRNAKPAQHHEEIIKLFGSCEQDVAEMLDIRTLLNESPSRRSARIEELIGGSGQDSKQLVENVGEQTVRRLYDGETDAPWRDLLRSLPTHEVSVLKDTQGYIQSVLSEENGIRSGIDWARKEKNEAHARISDGEKAVREIETRLESMPDADGTLADLSDERDRLQREYGQERERVSTANARKGEVEGLDKTIEEMQSLSFEGGSIEGAEGELKELESKYKGLVRPKYSDEAGQLANAAEQAERKYMDDKKASETRHRESERQAIELKDVVEGCKRDLRNAENDDWQGVYDLASRSEGKTEEDSISLCGIAEIATRNIGEPISNIKSRLEDATKQLQTFSGPLPDNTALIENARLIFVGAEEKHNAALKTHRELLAIYNSEEQRISHRMVQIQERLDEVGHARTRLNTAKAEREALGDIPELEDDRAEIQNSIDKVSCSILDAGQRASVKAEMQAILEDIDKRRARWTVLSAILWAMERVREEIVSEAGDPLTKSINAFLESASWPNRAYLAAEKGKCEIGWTLGGRTVLVKGMSGGEWQVFTTALIAAILELRAPAERLLLSEIGECDEEATVGILCGLKDANATAIAATHVEPVGPVTLEMPVIRLELEDATTAV